MTARVGNRPWEFVAPPVERDFVRGLAGDVVKQLKEARIELGLTQQCVADIAGFNQQAVCYGETGRTMSRLDLICGYAYVVRRRLMLAPWDGVAR